MVEVHRAMREDQIRKVSEASNELLKWQSEINKTEAYILEQIPIEIRTLSFEELVPELKAPSPRQEIIDEQVEELNKKLDEYTSLANAEFEKKRQLLVEAQKAMNA